MLTSAATVSENPTCSLSFRSVPVGREEARRHGDEAQACGSRASGVTFSTSRPAGVRARTRTLYVPSRRFAPSTVTVCFPGRVQTRSTDRRDRHSGRVHDLDGDVRGSGQAVAEDGGVPLPVAVRRDRARAWPRCAWIAERHARAPDSQRPASPVARSRSGSTTCSAPLGARVESQVQSTVVPVLTPRATSAFPASVTTTTQGWPDESLARKRTNPSPDSTRGS